MLTSDREEIEWPYSNAAATSCTRAQLEALLQGDAAERAIAHAALTHGQLLSLYSCTLGAFKHGERYKRVGRELIELGIFDYARGVGIRRLERILCRRPRLSRSEAIEALLES